jgi:hypothetical protein
MFPIAHGNPEIQDRIRRAVARVIRGNGSRGFGVAEMLKQSGLIQGGFSLRYVLTWLYSPRPHRWTDAYLLAMHVNRLQLEYRVATASRTTTCSRRLRRSDLGRMQNQYERTLSALASMGGALMLTRTHEDSKMSKALLKASPADACPPLDARS